MVFRCLAEGYTHPNSSRSHSGDEFELAEASEVRGEEVFPVRPSVSQSPQVMSHG